MLRRTTYTAVIATFAILAGYSVVRADSPYPTATNAPVVFSGFLTSSGTPLTGSHEVSMNLWQANDTSVSSNRVCQGSTQTVDVNAGSFKLQLDASCVDAFSRVTHVWYELVVDGTAFPLEQIGSVPFALRSMTGSSNGTRLVRQRTVTYGADGFRGDVTFGEIKDTLRNEACAQVPTFEGGVKKWRCLPTAVGGQQFDTTGFAQDVACTPYPPPTATLRYYGADQPFAYVYDIDASGNLTALYPATVQLTKAMVPLGGGCGILNHYSIGAFTLGAAIPLTEFVEMQTVTE